MKHIEASLDYYFDSFLWLDLGATTTVLAAGLNPQGIAVDSCDT
jgi:hypothetical protein